MSVFHRADAAGKRASSLEELLEQRLEAVIASWDQPRRRLTQSVGVVDEDSQSVRVLRTKGKTVNSMGFSWKGQKHLLMEEAMFLADQGYLLLFREDQTGHTQLLSVQETMELMVMGGVSRDAYEIYADIKSHGYAVFRHPLRVSLEPEEHPKELWQGWGKSASSLSAQSPYLIYEVFSVATSFKPTALGPPEQLVAHVPDGAVKGSDIAALEHAALAPVLLAFKSNADIVYYCMKLVSE